METSEDPTATTLQVTVIKGEFWVKLNFQAQLRHNVSYLISNCE